VQPPRIIAEIGCNHRGELATAREMVRVAAIFAGVDAVTFTSPVAVDVTQPFSSSSPALRVSVVRSRPRRSASRVIVAPPVLASAARIENCVARRPVGRRCSS